MDHPWKSEPHVEIAPRDRRNDKKLRMQECNCRLCWLALNATLITSTFAVYESFGLNKILKEQKQLIWSKR